jgi:HAD superfamily hydrolase (TIGR01509 family)
MDGVLVNSEPFIREASTRMFAEKGATIASSDFTPYVGTGEGRFIGGMVEKYGLALDVEAAKQRTYALYLELIRGRLQPLPGVYTFLAECRRRGLKVAVASSADAVKVRANLIELQLEEDAFDVVVTGDDVVRKKPAPDIFLRAAERIGLSAERCLVVEDAVAGVAAALAAGARCLALTTSFPETALGAANWTAPNLAAVPEPVWAALSG